MTNPLFWLVLSLLFVTISLTIVLVVAIPTMLELARAARSAEKLFDTLRREFPPTLEAIRLTGMEISDLTDDVSEGVQSASQVVKQVDQSLGDVRRQARKVRHGTRSVFAGVKAAWRTFSGSTPGSKSSVPQRRSLDRLPPARSGVEMTHSALDPVATQPAPNSLYSDENYPSQPSQTESWEANATTDPSSWNRPSPSTPVENSRYPQDDS